MAIRAVIEAHPTLKTAFAMDEKGEPYRYIRDCDVDITILEGDDLDPYSLIKPFDLQKDILFRIWLLKAVEGSRLLLDIHHSVFDGSSIGILLDQISRAYAGETVEPEVFTSLDYACEEAKKLGSKAYEEAKAYYREAFSGIDIDSSLYKDKNDRESVAREIDHTLEQVDADAVEAFARRNKIRQSTVFNGAFAYVLSRFSGAGEVLYSTLHHGRDERLQNTVGMFVKTCPVYVDISKSSDIRGFLEQLDTIIRVFRYAPTPVLLARCLAA